MLRHREYLPSTSVNNSSAMALGLDEIPSPATTRWTARRKGQVVFAIESRLLTFDEACARYSLSGEELKSWQDALRRDGVGGLRITRLQDYRNLNG